MVLNKWNYEKQIYETYEVSDLWKVTTSPYGVSCNCPHCGKELLIEKAYTSMEIHDDYGFGFYVCGTCYDAEQQRRIQAND